MTSLDEVIKNAKNSKMPTGLLKKLRNGCGASYIYGE